MSLGMVLAAAGGQHPVRRISVSLELHPETECQALRSSSHSAWAQQSLVSIVELPDVGMVAIGSHLAYRGGSGVAECTDIARRRQSLSQRLPPHYWPAGHRAEFDESSCSL